MIVLRIFECRLILYRPFLYYAIHRPTYAANWAAAHQYAEKAIAFCFQGLKIGCSPHRHHGTWFDLHITPTLAICVIAAVKCGTLAERIEPDWEQQIQVCIQRMRYWQDECPGITETIHILETLMGLQGPGN